MKEGELIGLVGEIFFLPIEKGGLELRRIKDFNLALLYKWHWRILGGSEALWYDVFKARYGDINLQVSFSNDNHYKCILKSTLWMDILSLDYIYRDNMFVDNFRFNNGSGFHTHFWQACWLDDNSLKDLFPVAYNLSEMKFASIACMGGWINGSWVWEDLGVRIDDNHEAATEVQRLHSFLRMRLQHAVRDDIS